MSVHGTGLYCLDCGKTEFAEYNKGVLFCVSCGELFNTEKDFDELRRTEIYSREAINEEIDKILKELKEIKIKYPRVNYFSFWKEVENAIEKENK